MKTLLIITSLALLCAPCFAQLGANFKECEAKYGRPSSSYPATGEAIYKKSGWQVEIHFIAGRAAVVTYLKLEGEFDTADMSRLLDDNGKDWQVTKATNIVTVYAGPDGRTATWDPTDHTFAFFSKAWKDYIAAKDAKRAQQN